MIPMAKPLIGEEEKEAVLEVLSSGQLAQGNKVEAFEERFADYIGVRHAIAVSSGTAALHTALLAYGIGEGDEVITSPFSFIATANAIEMVGARPVFVDVDESTFNIDIALVEDAVTDRTKVILPVHLFGLPAEMEKIQEIAARNNLIIIEDCAQAHGAMVASKRVGSFGTGCFSFYPTKNMTTGEGGIITTDDEKVAARIRKLINHGSEEKYKHGVLGYNYRMTDIAAAIGLEQLKKLEGFNEQRKRNALMLSEKLKGIKNIVLPKIFDNHVFHQYIIRVNSDFGKLRDELIEFLSAQGIGSSVFYPLPIHKQPAYQEHNHLSFPVAERLADEVLSLPVHPSLTEGDIQKIIEVVQEWSR